MDAVTTTTERLLLSCVLQNHEEVGVAVLSAFGNYCPFREPLHSLVWSHYCKHGAAFDMVIMEEVLESSGYGGSMRDLYNAAPTTANWQTYFTKVKEQYVTWNLAKALDSTARQLDNGAISPQRAIKGTQSVLNRCGDLLTTNTTESAVAALKSEAARRRAIKVRYRTGFTSYDKYIGDLVGSRLHIVGARTSVGKSMWAQNIVLNVARQGGGVGVLTLEMPTWEYISRIIGIVANTSADNALSQITSGEKTAEVEAAEREVLSLPIQYEEFVRVRKQPAAVEATIRRMVREHDCKVIILDYLQLISTRGNNRQQEIGALTGMLFNLTKELSIDIFALAQLNRGVEDMPQVKHLRESGNIEQDASTVTLLHRNNILNEQDHQRIEAGEHLPIYYIIGKNRGGKTCTIRGQVYFPSCRMAADRIADVDVPS